MSSSDEDRARAALARDAAGAADDETAAMDEVFAETIDRICASGLDRATREAAEDGDWPAALWTSFEQVGLPRCLVPEADGGAGLGLASAMRALRRTAYHAVPLPIAEALVATRMLQAAGVPVPDGVLTVAQLGADGTAARVPWGERCDALVAVEADGQALVLLEGRAQPVATDRNLAGEPRPTLRVDAMRRIARVALPGAGERLLLEGALARSAQVCGALGRALQESITYANERKQFGRPIGSFQAVQHMLAVQASLAAAASAACEAAIDASGETPDALAVAIAKARVSEAAGQGADIAHQVLGAMGFTREHLLHNLTRRLYAWRDEYGAEVFWQRRIGQAVCANGADALWPMLTGF